jgi:hypothetical protein
MRLMAHCRGLDVFPKALNRMCTYCEMYELCLSCDDPQIRDLLYTKRIETQESSDNVGEKESAT